VGSLTGGDRPGLTGSVTTHAPCGSGTLVLSAATVLGETWSTGVALVHPDGYLIRSVVLDRGTGPRPYLRLVRGGVGWLGDFDSVEALVTRLERMGLYLSDFSDDGSPGPTERARPTVAR
jgi:hypothetical protein